MLVTDTFGARVRRLRLQHALTQQDLANRAGVSRQVIIRAEADTRPPRPSNVRKIAQALGVKPTALTIGRAA